MKITAIVTVLISLRDRFQGQILQEMASWDGDNRDGGNIVVFGKTHLTTLDRATASKLALYVNVM